MTTPQITYRGMPHSPAMDARIVELAARHVVVDETDRHKHKGNLFQVHVDLHVPGSEIVATHQSNTDAYAAINDAFDVVTRRLEDNVRRQRP